MSQPRIITVGSLFSGIGGIDLGLERASNEHIAFKTVFQVENDPYATQVLEKHWPNVRRWGDVRTFPPEGDWRCDLIAGGFPCQGLSRANLKGDGLQDPRSGLWADFARVVGILRPRYVFVENSEQLTKRGLGTVLSDFARLRYDAEWCRLPAQAVGAPHFRERCYVVAYTNSKSALQADSSPNIFRTPGPRSGTDSDDWHGRSRTHRQLLDSDICRVADGVPSRVDRLRCLGNAVVPQVAQWIGERILEHERSLT